jgi:D-alanyl-D-alanine carboxypeptidase
MTDQLPVSANAARRPPSKLGLKAGQTIDVRTAVMALCVKSANDVATVVAEYLGGTEERFAAMMTAKARQLGMNGTVFANASGLPDTGQRTTARDMAVLAMALRARFPHHYHFFSNQKFAYAGKTINGHNNLLGKVPGVDGLKTGYIRASGYNLATSAGRGGRRIVAVVMGGKSAKGRDQHMQELIAAYLPRASGS